MSAHAHKVSGRLGAFGALLAVVVALCFAMAGSGALAFADEVGGTPNGGTDAPSNEGAIGEGDEGAAEAGETDEFAQATAATINGGPPPTEQPVDGTTDGTDGASDEENVGKNLVDPTQRADNSFIYDTSIGAIAGQSSLYDKRTVQVEGEVIGDRIAEGPGYYWIELSSSDEGDTANISVLISEDQTAQIDRYGRYGVTGTTLQVRGTYHQACDEHEGLSDIHATNSAVVAPGVDHKDAFEIGAFLPGVITVVIGVILLLVFRFARERLR